MPTIAFRRFSNPDILKKINFNSLLELLVPYRDFLASKNFMLPEDSNFQDSDYEKLAKILITPDTDFPKELADALFYIDEMSTNDFMDKILDTLKTNNLKYHLEVDSEPIDIAIQLWLNNRQLLEEIHAEHYLIRPRSFLYFQTERDPIPKFIQPKQDVIKMLEEEMDLWFDSKKRGIGCRVFIYPQENEYWFLVRHGQPIRREGSLDQGKTGSVFYRPQQHDVLVYDTNLGEIRIHTGSKGERELYRACFGKYLFNDEDYFPKEGKYNLQPLKDLGTDSLSVQGVEEYIDWIKLKEIQISWGNEIEIRKSQDLFDVFEKRGFQFKGFHNLIRAVFSIKFKDSRRPRSLTIQPSNKANYERDYDSNIIEKWLTLRGFIEE